MKTTLANGYYMNIYKNYTFDLFIIFNEANSEPTKAEINALQYIVEEEMENENLLKDRKEFASHLQRVIEETEFDCVEYGVQILIKVWNL